VVQGEGARLGSEDMGGKGDDVVGIFCVPTGLVGRVVLGLTKISSYGLCENTKLKETD